MKHIKISNPICFVLLSGILITTGIEVIPFFSSYDAIQEHRHWYSIVIVPLVTWALLDKLGCANYYKRAVSFGSNIAGGIFALVMYYFMFYIVFYLFFLIVGGIIYYLLHMIGSLGFSGLRLEDVPPDQYGVPFDHDNVVPITLELTVYVQMIVYLFMLIKTKFRGHNT